MLHVHSPAGQQQFRKPQLLAGPGAGIHGSRACQCRALCRCVDLAIAKEHHNGSVGFVSSEVPAGDSLPLCCHCQAERRLVTRPAHVPLAVRRSGQMGWLRAQGQVHGHVLYSPCGPLHFLRRSPLRRLHFLSSSLCQGLGLCHGCAVLCHLSHAQQAPLWHRILPSIHDSPHNFLFRPRLRKAMAPLALWASPAKEEEKRPAVIGAMGHCHAAYCRRAPANGHAASLSHEPRQP
mmetsp:Transcript_19612/g.75279  ORF Transcript_19612/g.75279 Transcript_19612/m.75279 type:complete len:235 (-) Transcript_19612:789-1493(-)